jgi:hypothetical protein
LSSLASGGLEEGGSMLLLLVLLLFSALLLGLYAWSRARKRRIAARRLAAFSGQ